MSVPACLSTALEATLSSSKGRASEGQLAGNGFADAESIRLGICRLRLRIASSTRSIDVRGVRLGRFGRMFQPVGIGGLATGLVATAQDGAHACQQLSRLEV